MGLTTRTYSLSSHKPEIGLIVLYHPPRVSEATPSALPAIIHLISDADRGIVDLTIFTPRGPVVKTDVQVAGGWMEDRWTYRG